MRLVSILVEGETEEAFVDQVLAPALLGLILQPVIVKTSREGARPARGGTVKYKEFEKQARLLLRDPNAVLVTTLLDYQGLGSDYPGRADRPAASAIDKVRGIESAMKDAVDDGRYEPFLFLHEFEAMLFVHPENLAKEVDVPHLAEGMRAILAKYGHEPEAINDSPATSPSARIENLCAELGGSRERFQKRLHGPTAIGMTGLGPIRTACPHFHEWLSKLEALSA